MNFVAITPSFCGRRQKVSRRQLERRLANIPRCLIGNGGPLGSRHIGRQLAALGHDVRLIPAQYVKPFLRVTRTTIAMPRRSRKPARAHAMQSQQVHLLGVLAPFGQVTRP
jgi:transposase